MRRIILALIMLFCLNAAGCGRADTEDPNRLTGIFTPVFSSSISGADTVQFSRIQPMEDGYALVMEESNYPNRKNGENIWETVSIVNINETGEITGSIPLGMEWFENDYVAGERGVYLFNRDTEGYKLYHIDWNGEILHTVDTADFRPGSANSQTPQTITYMSELPVRETEAGLAIVWGKRCILLDENLVLTGEIELPGKGDTVFTEGDTLWISYEEKGVRMLGRAEDGVLAESWPMPELFCGINQYSWLTLIGCRDGWLYAWNSTGIHRWQFGAEEETIEPVMDFLHSGISGSKVQQAAMLEEDLFSIHTTPDNGSHVQTNLYRKAPDKDLSQMTVLTIAAIQSTEEMEQAVLQFNASHADAYIRIVTYDQYNTADEPIKGYNLMRTDLTTGLLKADIICGEAFEPVDLYPLMTGAVQKEDIAPCVRNQYEEDGKLMQIGSTFSIDTLVGRTDALDSMTGWDLEGFLEFVEGLEEGEYLIEDVGWDIAYSTLFRMGMYDPFIRDGKASFEDPLFLRYLAFLQSLPEHGQKYMDHGKDNTAALFAGEITMDQLQVEESGENLYWNGRIKLTQEYRMNSMHNLLKLCRTFNTTDLSFIGYPAEGGKGVRVQLDSVYSIPVTCKNTALAWEFIESILHSAAVFPEEDEPDADTLRWNTFTTLHAPYFAHLESLRGLRIFTGHSMGVYIDWELETDDKGRYRDQPGTLQEIDETMIGLVRNLYETAGTQMENDLKLFEIVREEELRYLAGAVSAEECADIVQSRVSIYLAENN